jgi:hypothetical protein
MKACVFVFSLFVLSQMGCSSIEADNVVNADCVLVEEEALLYPKNIVHFSQDFYLAIKYEEPIAGFLDTLSRLNVDQLSTDLTIDNIKLAFWINIYNSLVQSKLLNDEKSFANQEQFFKNKDLVIGGCKISLDEIEHGIIRGVDSNSDLVNKFKLNKLDYRIHFTMNCGASSCPAIAYYKPETLEEDLNAAEQVFVSANSSYDSLSNVLLTSELFNWFQTDFNGEKGVLELMRTHGVIQENTTPILKYESYNWELKSKNYQ